MICSEARLAANRANGCKGKGPLRPETRAISAKNSLKHGLTGAGIVIPEGDREEIARRAEALTDDMKPKSQAGLILILQLANLSVRMERAGEHELAAIAKNVRHAAEDFDDARLEKVNELFEVLADRPSASLRRLRRMPEGVERLIEAWHDLRADLTIKPEPLWTAAQLEQAANLTGIKARHAGSSRLGALSQAYWGDFSALGDDEGAGLDEASRREWARAQLLESIDAEVADLKAHYESLDFATLEVDRSESGLRARFDASKPACLARRYESEATRGFFRCLREFRKVEAEFAAPIGAIPATPSAPKAAEAGSEMGSFRENARSLERELARAFPEARSEAIPAARLPESREERRARRPKLPR